MLDSKDKAILEERGYSEEDIELQLRLLSAGCPHAALVAPALVDDGITRLAESEVDSLCALYDEERADLNIVKFVPASGAASRMFKDLKTYLSKGEKTDFVNQFLECKTDFAFWEDRFVEFTDREFIDTLLHQQPLAYATCAKGSVPFHRYENGPRTAFEEHLREGFDYADNGQVVHVHFTLPVDKRVEILDDLASLKQEYSGQYDGEFILSSSVQLADTDVMALNKQGEVIRTDDGRILLRPGGHGALIHNVDGLDADLIFIKNIDNVVPDNKRGDTIRYKKALAGYLLQLKKQALHYVHQLSAGLMEQGEVLIFLQELGYKPMANPTIEEMIHLLNRPYRVCGMVKNEGEPGGGPFWIRTEKGSSLQIVESAQIDKSNPQQAKIASESTHFNPVDLICSPYDLSGNKIDLLAHRDMHSSFVTTKVINGQEARVMEWPGLWNGAMADWNTVFVEVPLTTFNPVKTVNDLLRPMHRV